MNSYSQKQVAIIVNVISMALVFLLVGSIASCGSGPCIPNADGTGCLPPTAQPPTPTLAPPPVPELIEVRKGDDTKVDPKKNPNMGEKFNYDQAKSYLVLPSHTVKIVIKPIDYHYQLVVRLNGESIIQLEPGKDLRGDDARFTWNVFSLGNEWQEVITILPKAKDRDGSGFTLKISTKPIDASNEESQSLLIFIGGANNIFSKCLSIFGTVYGNSSPPPLYTPNARFIPLVYGNNPIGTVTSIDYLFSDFGSDSSLRMTFIDALNTTPMDFASIYFYTTSSRHKTIRALNGNTCQYSHELNAKGGVGFVGPITITKNDTTTLVLFDDEQMVAVWSEVGFWDAFGGKKIRFYWPYNIFNCEPKVNC
jgi:hypothetical protein